MCEINTRCDRSLPNRKNLTPEVFRFVTLFRHYCTRRQWTVTDSLKNMAFAHINEDNISSLLRSKDSKSTQRSVARSIKLFKDYLLQKDESVYFFQWFRFTVKNSLLLNFYCFSLFHFLLLYYLS